MQDYPSGEYIERNPWYTQLRRDFGSLPPSTLVMKSFACARLQDVSDTERPLDRLMALPLRIKMRLNYGETMAYREEV